MKFFKIHQNLLKFNFAKLSKEIRLKLDNDIDVTGKLFNNFNPDDHKGSGHVNENQNTDNFEFDDKQNNENFEFNDN